MHDITHYPCARARRGGSRAVASYALVRVTNVHMHTLKSTFTALLSPASPANSALAASLVSFRLTVGHAPILLNLASIRS